MSTVLLGGLLVAVVVVATPVADRLRLLSQDVPGSTVTWVRR